MCVIINFKSLENINMLKIIIITTGAIRNNIVDFLRLLFQKVDFKYQ